MPETAPEAVGPRGTEMAEECLAVRVRLLSRRLSRIYDGALRPLGLTVAQLNVLCVLDVSDRARAGRVADLLAMEISTLSRNARIMESEGWITIDRAEHGNGRVLRLTSAGRQKLRKARPAWDRAQTEARELLGGEGARELKRLGDGVWDDQLRHL
ncbi:MAG TPA: MarR family winged helix-turn-helix transcriptional regulator [Solirubrobacteraceae bacterium]|jgi:DNA-binding MarR family transcriptional regulator|nr:MarR family winged helix-turn-helix transcriptional regulator [Solirubrobacteraceae bacterium]